MGGAGGVVATGAVVDGTVVWDEVDDEDDENEESKLIFSESTLLGELKEDAARCFFTADEVALIMPDLRAKKWDVVVIPVILGTPLTRDAVDEFERSFIEGLLDSHQVSLIQGKNE